MGILSERDLLLRVGLRLVSIENEPVSTVMTREPLTLDCEAPLAFALNYMTLHDFRHLPLTRDGELEGIISLRDFLALLFRTYPEIAQSKHGVEPMTASTARSLIIAMQRSRTMTTYSSLWRPSSPARSPSASPSPCPRAPPTPTSTTASSTATPRPKAG